MVGSDRASYPARTSPRPLEDAGDRAAQALHGGVGGSTASAPAAAGDRGGGR